jgi:hypothetical protein
VPPRDEMHRADFGMPVNTRGHLIEAHFTLRGDADIDKGDDALVAQAIPVDDRLVAADHSLPLELIDKSDDMIFSDAGQRGETLRVAARVGDERRQHAADSWITAVQTPLPLLTIRIELSQPMSPSPARAHSCGTSECTPGGSAFVGFHVHRTRVHHHS